MLMIDTPILIQTLIHVYFYRDRIYIVNKKDEQMIRLVHLSTFDFLLLH